MNPVLHGSRSPENTLILNCLRAFVQDKEKPDISLVQNAGFRWSLWLQTLTDQRVSGHVLKVLEKHAMTQMVPEDCLRELREGVQLNRRGFEVRKKQFEKLYQLCRANGIGILPYKGSALALTHFTESPFRFMSDVDFIVRPREALKLYDLLRKEGFSVPLRSYPNRWQRQIMDDCMMAPAGRVSLLKQGWDLDLHIRVMYRLGSGRVGFEAERLWLKSRELRCETGEIRFMDPKDHALLILLHAAELYDPRLSQLVDAAVCMKQDALSLESMREAAAEACREEALEAVTPFIQAAGEMNRDTVFSEEARKALDDFFLKRKKQPGPVRGQSGWKKLGSNLKTIPDFKRKCQFLAGFFVPDPDYYRNSGLRGAGLYLHHWANLLRHIVESGQVK